MTRISLKALLGAGSLAVAAAVSLAPAAYAQMQPAAAMNPQPSYSNPASDTMGAAGQPGAMAPNGAMLQQNAYGAPQSEPQQPTEFHQLDPRYPGPRLN